MKTLTFNDPAATEDARFDNRAGAPGEVLSRPSLGGTGIFLPSQS
ncbi:hypothetical protein [Aromatoleum buckelii]|nr:hypothetical protein [Aromatoleum buckelii]